jgi:hypothetical protein
LRALIGCEFSGRVREAMRRHGVDAYSCDLLDAEDDSDFHYRQDLLDVIYGSPEGEEWQLGIFHPDCTHHVVSGARWFREIPCRPKPGVFYGPERYAARERDRAFVLELWGAPIPRIAIENPIGTLGDVLGAPTQIVQPYYFGDQAIKTTCLWLKNLPPLVRTSDLEPPADPLERRKWQECWNEAPGPDRKKNRSRTYPGLAEAMAAQWGCLA